VLVRVTSWIISLAAQVMIHEITRNNTNETLFTDQRWRCRRKPRS